MTKPTPPTIAELAARKADLEAQIQAAMADKKAGAPKTTVKERQAIRQEIADVDQKIGELDAKAQRDASRAAVASAAEKAGTKAQGFKPTAPVVHPANKVVVPDSE